MAKFFSFRRESDAPRARRFTELFLLVLAVGISSFGMYLINPEHAFDTSKSQWLPCTVVLGAGALLIHLVMQFRARYADPFILPLVVALNGIGLTMIYRLDPQIAAPVGDGQLMGTGVSRVLGAFALCWIAEGWAVVRCVTSYVAWPCRLSATGEFLGQSACSWDKGVNWRCALRPCVVGSWCHVW